MSKNVFEVGDKRVSVRCADGKVMVRVGGGYMKLCVFLGRGCACDGEAVQHHGCGHPGNRPFSETEPTKAIAHDGQRQAWRSDWLVSAFRYEFLRSYGFKVGGFATIYRQSVMAY